MLREAEDRGQKTDVMSRLCSNLDITCYVAIHEKLSPSAIR
jgi:hypothetical protein